MWGLCASIAQLRGALMHIQVHTHVGLILSVTVRCGIRSLESYTIPLIYKLLSRKRLNSEEYGNASGNGTSLFTFPTAGDILICTNTEGPSPDRAPSFYILIITVLTSDVHGDKTPHILKRPFTYSLHELKNSTRRFLCLLFNQ